MAVTCISASRREDMPAFKAGECFRAMEMGIADAKNPVTGEVTTVDIPEGSHFVWWSKDYSPWISACEEMPEVAKKYKHYFQFTINPPGELEPGIRPAIGERVAQLDWLASNFGAESVMWRLDPVVVYLKGDEIRNNFDAGVISEVARAAIECKLRAVTMSFVDWRYEKVRKRFARKGMTPVVVHDSIKVSILAELRKIVAPLEVRGCCQSPHLGLAKAQCVPDFGQPRDTAQRDGCGCHKATDIGKYNSCKHSCLYCYAMD